MRCQPRQVRKEAAVTVASGYPASLAGAKFFAPAFFFTRLGPRDGAGLFNRHFAIIILDCSDLIFRFPSLTHIGYGTNLLKEEL